MKRKRAKKAYWTQETHLFRDDEFICSVCGAAAGSAWAYCPSCGAEMGRCRYEPSWVDEAEMADILFGDW